MAPGNAFAEVVELAHIPSATPFIADKLPLQDPTAGIDSANHYIRLYLFLDSRLAQFCQPRFQEL